jgi:hypothetical protein
LPVVQSCVALLLGQQDAEAVKQAPGFHWLPDVPLPWGDSKFLVLGARFRA